MGISGYFWVFSIRQLSDSNLKEAMFVGNRRDGNLDEIWMKFSYLNNDIAAPPIPSCYTTLSSHDGLITISLCSLLVRLLILLIFHV